MLQPVSMFQKDPNALAGKMEIEGALFPIRNLVLGVADREKKLIQKPIWSQTAITSLHEFRFDAKAELLVRVSYESAGVKIQYTAPLQIPALELRGYIPFLTQVPVHGSVIEDYCGSYSMRIQLDTGRVIGCEQRNHPIDYLLAGGDYRFRISPNHGGWGHDLRLAETLNPGYREAPIAAMQGVGDLSVLTDSASETGLRIEDPVEFIFRLAKPTEVSSVYLAFHGGKRSPHRLDARVNGKWILMRNGATPGLMPVIPAKTSQIRLRFTTKTKVNMSELRFITPAPPRKTRFSW